jgi:hypothetical protein
LQLDAAHLVHLPPEVRDRLLKYLADWGSPGEQLQLAEALREAHGPLLFLLDYQAHALFKHEEYERAPEVIERRQRRSTTIASQAMEAKALLAAGLFDFCVFAPLFGNPLSGSKIRAEQ